MAWTRRRLLGAERVRRIHARCAARRDPRRERRDRNEQDRGRTERDRIAPRLAEQQRPEETREQCKHREPGGQPDSLRINPTQQHGGAATDFAWGYRLALRGQYSHAIGSISLYPSVILFHDLGGISPATIDNYVAGRKTINLGIDADLAQSLVVGVQYQWFTGAGGDNLRSDRDNYGLHLSYSF